MAIDLNATPEEEGEHVLDLNKAPGEQDVHDSFQVAVQAGEHHEAQTLPRVSLEGIGLADERLGRTSWPVRRQTGRAHATTGGQDVDPNRGGRLLGPGCRGMDLD